MKLLEDIRERLPTKGCRQNVVRDECLQPTCGLKQSPADTVQARQNSKSMENCNCLGMPALLAVANTGMGELSAPYNWFRATTFVWLRRLNDSTTKSSLPCSPTLRNFST